MRVVILLLFIKLFCVNYGQCAEKQDEINIEHVSLCSATQTSTISFTDYFSNLLETKYWPARWTCGTWTEGEGWFYIASDLSIFIAYFSIPIMLLWYVRRKDLGKFKWIIALFIAFIGLCGLTHLVDAVMFWEPVYRLSGLLKFLTGVVSIGTAIALTYTIPVALKYKSPREMQREISERKKAQQLFELFVNNTPGAIAMFDKDMNYLMVNKNWVRDYGLSENSLIGKSHYEVFPEIQGMDEWKAFHQRALNGETIKNDHDSFIHDGQEVFLRWQLHPWHDGTGDIGGIIMLTEVTTQTETLKNELERRIVVNENQNSIIEDLSSVAKIGTWQLDTENRKVHWSNVVYDIHEVKRGSQVVYDEAINFYHHEDVPIISEAVEKAFRFQKTWDLELRIVTAKGNLKWIRSIGQPHVVQGKMIGLQGLFQDIDLKKRAEELLTTDNLELEFQIKDRTEALEAANKELESFTYSVSHDLRAPLRAINGFAEALEEDFGTLLPDDGKRFLSRISKNSQKMGMLIDDLLEFSKLNKRTERISELNLNELVTELISELFADHKEIIELNELPTIYGDEIMIRQVFQNLISNAIKYSSKEPDPEIKIGSFRKEETTIIYIDDNGAGFDPRFSDKLFGIFQRLHREDEFEGTGVGLALTHKIITRHGGKIWAESELGKGATFYVSLKIIS